MTEKHTGRPAVFCDRDGVINWGPRVDRVEQFDMIKGAPAALETIGRDGFLRVLVTNQTSLGEDLAGNVVWPEARLNRAHLQQITDRMHYLLGFKFDAVKFCPHAYFAPYNVECECHKPKPGMILEAARELDIDLSRSWMIGDRAPDILAGKAAGVRYCILITSTGDGKPEDLEAISGGCFVAPSIREAAEIIHRVTEHEHRSCFDPRNWA